MYGDVSKLEFFQRTKLDYRDVCDPSLLIKNPERYFGWAALNLTKYRAARPHAGYDLLRHWRDGLYSSTSTPTGACPLTWSLFGKELMLSDRPSSGEGGEGEQRQGADEVVRQLHAKISDPTSIRSMDGLGISALPGRVFVFTTNVDGFFLRAGFKPEEASCNRSPCTCSCSTRL